MGNGCYIESTRKKKSKKIHNDLDIDDNNNNEDNSIKNSNKCTNLVNNSKMIGVNNKISNPNNSLDQKKFDFDNDQINLNEHFRVFFDFFY